MSSLNTVRMACLNACASVEGFHRSGYLHPRQTALFTLQQRDSWSFLQSALSGLKGTGPRLMEHSCRLGTASCLRGPLRSGFKTKKNFPFPYCSASCLMRPLRPHTQECQGLAIQEVHFLSLKGQIEKTVYHPKLPVLLGSGFRGVTFLGFSTTVTVTLLFHYHKALKGEEL